MTFSLVRSSESLKIYHITTSFEIRKKTTTTCHERYKHLVLSTSTAPRRVRFVRCSYRTATVTSAVLDLPPTVTTTAILPPAAVPAGTCRLIWATPETNPGAPPA